MDSAAADDVGPPMDPKMAANYQTITDVLSRLIGLCVKEGGSVEKPRQQEQRLLRNMSAHSAVLELLQIPYDKVFCCFLFINVL